MGLSTTQLDKLGRRLTAEVISDDDLRLLDDYRRSFSVASTEAVQLIRNQLGFEPTARPAKSKLAIVDKLRRQKTRLSTMQDIAGCRLVVNTLATQRGLAAKLVEVFSIERQDDRVAEPSHGYRAHHLIAIVAGKLFEFKSELSCSICGLRCLKRRRIVTATH